MSRRSFFTILSLGISFVIGADISGVTNTATNLLLELPNGRAQESEADANGLMLMAKACFDPERAPELWQRMHAAAEKMGAGNVPAFLSTHPSDASRERRLRELLPKAMDVRSQLCDQAQSFWSR